MKSRSHFKSISNGLTLAAAAAALVACQSAPPNSQAPSNPLLGTWRLASFQMETQATGERVEPMGKSPAGYLSFTPDGRMSVVITAEGRKPPTSDADRAGLYGSLVAYTGKYRVQGDQWITKVEASANPAWVHTEQPRSYKVEGRKMEETTPWFPRADRSMVRVRNVWERDD